MVLHKKYLLLITFTFGFIVNLGNIAVPFHSIELHKGYIGLFFATSGFGLFFFSTLWGSLGDIKDRNKVLAFTFLGYAIGQFVFGVSNNGLIMLLGAMISGVFSAGFLVNIYSYINDNFEEISYRNKTLSYAVSLLLIGSSFGYLFGGYLVRFFAPNYWYVFMVQSCISLLFFVFVFFEKTDLIDTDHHLSRRHFYINMRQIFRLPWLPIYTISMTFFISFSHNNVKRFFDIYLVEEMYSSFDIGVIIFTTGIVTLLTNIFISPLLLKFFHNIQLLMVLFLFVPVFLFLTFNNGLNIYKIYSYFMIYHVLMAIYEPTAISLMSSNRTVPQGILVGVRQSVVGLGMTIGFIVGGQLYELNSTNVFYFAVFFYIIVFVGFTLLNLILQKEISEYKGGLTHD